MNIKGILFDLYGTLLIGDTDSAWKASDLALSEKLTGFGLTFSNLPFDSQKEGMWSCVVPVGGADGFTSFERRINAFCSGLGLVLSEQDIRSTADACVEGWQKHFWLDPDVIPLLLDTIVISGQVGIEKPDPNIFRSLPELLGLFGQSYKASTSPQRNPKHRKDWNEKIEIYGRANYQGSEIGGGGTKVMDIYHEYGIGNDAIIKDNIVKQLACRPVDYRHLLSVLDSEWNNLCNKVQEYKLDCINNKRLYILVVAGVGYVWQKPSVEELQPIADFVINNQLNELTVLGNECFEALKPVLTEGNWRYSRNYSANSTEFRPRFLDCIKKLEPEDKSALERASETVQYPISRSTWRDFEQMTQDSSTVCYGVIDNDTIVAFCSSNPIYKGVREISWIVVDPEYRRRGLASAMLSAHAKVAFERGEVLGYHAGSGEDDLNAMLTGLGFEEVTATYRFIPAHSSEQWRIIWGIAV